MFDMQFLQHEVARVSHAAWEAVKSIPPLNRSGLQGNVRKMGNRPICDISARFSPRAVIC
jgi:hypothetical protein